MKKFLYILTSTLVLTCMDVSTTMAQQIKIVYGKVLNKPEGKNKGEPFPANEKVYIFAFNPNRSLEPELALFLMTAIRKMWLYIVGS